MSENTENNGEAPRRSARSTSRPNSYSQKAKRNVKDTVDAAVETATEDKNAVVELASEAAAAVQPTVDSAIAAVQSTVDAAVAAVQPTVDAAVAAVQPAVDAIVGDENSENPVSKKAKTVASKLAVGSSLPAITLKDDKDVDVSIGDLKKAVIFIYPKADTPGCTTQACNFRDSKKEFTDLGYTVYGLSTDTVAAQSNWEKKNKFDYSLLSDKAKALLGPLGVVSGPSVKRSHVVVDGEGKIAMLSLGVKPADSTKQALEKVKELEGKAAEASTEPVTAEAEGKTEDAAQQQDGRTA